MHTALSRGNSVLAYTLTVLAGLTFCCFLSTVVKDYRQTIAVEPVKILVKNVPDYSANREENDLGFVTFNLNADLTPLFNWNVKQLFVFLTAEYETESNKVNQVVLWDKIILREENANITLKDHNPKYYFWDDGNGLKGNKNVTLTLSWNVIPNAGQLPIILADGSSSVSFPAQYHSRA